MALFLMDSDIRFYVWLSRRSNPHRSRRASWRRSKRPALVITQGNAVVGALVGAPGLAKHTWPCLIC